MITRTDHAYYHECEKQPEGVKVLKWYGPLIDYWEISVRKAYPFDPKSEKVLVHTQSVGGIEYCPYCGEVLPC